MEEIMLPGDYISFGVFIGLFLPMMLVGVCWMALDALMDSLNERGRNFRRRLLVASALMFYRLAARNYMFTCADGHEDQTARELYELSWNTAKAVFLGDIPEDVFRMLRRWHRDQTAGFDYRNYISLGNNTQPGTLVDLRSKLNVSGLGTAGLPESLRSAAKELM